MSEPAHTLASLYMLLMLAGSGQPAHAGSADALVDPTRPRGWQAPVAAGDDREAADAGTFKLHGTYSVAGRRSAVINGQRVRVGDQVSGAEVMEIHKDRVLLRLDGENVELVRTVPMVKAPVDIRKTADNRTAGQLERLLK